MNRICGHKVSITAASPQTTRNTVRGILTEERGQLVFLDTPGYHNSQQKFNRYLKNLAQSTLEESDQILYLLDPHRPFGPEEEQLMKLIAEAGKPTVVALNKIDLNPRRVAEAQRLVAERLPHSLIYLVSALKDAGVEDLVAGLYLQAPEGEYMYPPEYYTDQDPEFRISEIIREQTIRRLRQELPHAVYVKIVDSDLNEAAANLAVRATIFVERESQKGMVVGKKGGMIKQIRLSSEEILADIFPYRVSLDLRVKVDPKWRTRDQLLQNMIN